MLAAVLRVALCSVVLVAVLPLAACPPTIDRRFPELGPAADRGNESRVDAPPGKLDRAPVDAPRDRPPADLLADLVAADQGPPAQVCPPPGVPPLPCVLGCATSPCAMDCASSTYCTVNCVNRTCNVDCGAAPICLVYCASGKCNVNCKKSSCAVYCASGACQVNCSQAFACVAECPGGTCPITR